MQEFDVAVIGGGINGCGIARDAAGRGLSVFLAEQGDLASVTSSASTKLIHGGLRYLEHFRLRLVRESLAERERLMALAPHLVRPVRLVMPQVPGSRLAWKLRLGFALYDWLGGSRTLPRARVIDLADDPAGAPLRPGLHRAFEFSECLTDDARLVIANAMGAREKGAVIRPRTRCVAARREDGRWLLVLQSGGQRETVTARALVNATGPWVAHFIETVAREEPRRRVRLVKGSHIVVPRLYAHDRAYLLPNDDGRLVFAVPFADDFTLVGTTEVEMPGYSTDVAASSEEILYLCRVASEFFRAQIRPSALRWTFAGVRTLVDDGRQRPAEITRDYWIDVAGGRRRPPLVSVYGGKLTTYRRLAEKTVERLAPWMTLGPAWTDREPLPGGDLGLGGVEELVRALGEVHPWLAPTHARRLACAYGTRVWTLLGDARRLDDLGPRIVGDLHVAELDYLREHEWASTAEDILWRRTKFGLVASEVDLEMLRAILAVGRSAEQLAGRARRA